MATEILNTQEINERLQALSPVILPPNLALYYAELDELREQTVNPRSMPQKMLNQLIENVSSSGGLESAPLCVRVGDHIEIISGHHRVRAAREAGVKRLLVYLYTELTVSQIKAKQLAHNTIAGRDDPEMVKRIWDEITDISARFEAFVDPRIFDDVPDRVKFTQIDVDLAEASRQVLILFLPVQQMDFDAAMSQIVPTVDLDTVYLAGRDIYDEWRKALQRVREEVDIVSVPTAIAEMARLAMEVLDAKAEAAEQDDG